jgi:thiamine biosynthesis protein ThiS
METPMHPTLRINGTEKQFPQDRLPKTLAELLAELKIDQATVVAEIDGQIVARINFATAPIQPGQSIELVRFVGGG